jgi:hypothetical protein
MGAGCKQIEVCATKCIAGGTAAKQCATDCILWDGGTPPDGTSTTDLTPGQNAAEQLDLCLLVACQGICAS